MADIYIQYNPYTVETIIEVDGKDIMKEGKLSQYKSDRLQVWIQDLLPVIDEVANENQLDIRFKGTIPDYEDLLEVCEQYSESNPSIKITIEPIPAKDTSHKLMELENLVAHMQNGPFDALKDPKIQQNFEKALNRQFEIAVIATMSSGKSTLINAFLGQELMPSKNEACTAKISKIKNDNELEEFSAVCFDSQGNELTIQQNVMMTDMERFNEDPNISLIEIDGNIPSISSRKMNLVLVDTPGPNNSMDGSHREHTLRVIKDDDKPMVLYVLNATQLKTDDDYALLKIVAEAMKVGGKQSKDRFIFAVNKADCFDPEKGENLVDVLRNVKTYLEQHGIENPNVYPISAETAKVIRKYQNGHTLTRHEKQTLNGIDLFLEESVMHLETYAPLSPSLKNNISDQIMMARDRQDEEAVTLYHTGVPGIEAAINEYLDKYAVTSKITNAVNSFKRIVEREQIMQNLQQRMADDQQERDKIHQEMEKLEKELEKGEKAQKFKQKIQNLNFNIDQYFEQARNKIFGQQLQGISDKFRNQRISKHEADVILYKVKKEVDILQDDAVTDLEKVITQSLRNNGEQYIQEYHHYVHNIMDFKESKIQVKNWDKAIMVDIPDIEELINEYTVVEQEWVGTKTVRNENKKWYKPWTWKDDKYYEEDIYEDREYIDMTELREEFLVPVRLSLKENFDNAKSFAEDEQEKLKIHFIQEINRLEALMKERVQEIKMLSGRSFELEDQLKKNEEEKRWLNEFVAQLDAILEV
ncbi:dynamin family protein [Bacillus sp. JJ722]|uniref:dynamin family protein n=1 Tax=Bacillus sp. JJ722 TaxID=3122973 RepID=UPI002FFD6BD0